MRGANGDSGNVDPLLDNLQLLSVLDISGQQAGRYVQLGDVVRVVANDQRRRDMEIALAVSKALRQVMTALQGMDSYSQNGAIHRASAIDKILAIVQKHEI